MAANPETISVDSWVMPARLAAKFAVNDANDVVYFAGRSR